MNNKHAKRLNIKTLASKRQTDLFIEITQASCWVLVAKIKHARRRLL